MKKFLTATALLMSLTSLAHSASPVTLFAKISEMDEKGNLNPQPLDDIPYVGAQFSSKEECEAYPKTEIGKKHIEMLGEALQQRYPKAAAFGVKLHCEDGGPGRSYNDTPHDHHAPPSSEGVRPLAPLGDKI